MNIKKAYRFQLKVTAEQAGALSRFAGCNRLVWNKGLAVQKKLLDENKRVSGYAELCSKLVVWKKELTFLSEVHSQPLQQVLKDLSRALKDSFIGAKGFPKFKKKGKQDSFRFPQGFRLDGNKIYLPKLGWFKFRKSQKIQGCPKNVTVSRVADKWYVSVQVEMDVPEPVHPSHKSIGIDVGIVKFATMSDGTSINPVSSFRKWEDKLANEQQKLSQRVKFSKNWKKQRKRVTRVHLKIANVRRDFLHKSTTQISKNHAIVVLEDMKVRNMSASAKGTVAAPGRNVKAKSGLNKSILDQGWYEFRRQLTYKQEWLGGTTVLVNPVNTSRTCSKCHHVARQNRQTQAVFACCRCGHAENADVNAARNILAAGHAVIACGDLRQVAV
jgi:putative transposase